MIKMLLLFIQVEGEKMNDNYMRKYSATAAEKLEKRVTDGKITCYTVKYGVKYYEHPTLGDEHPIIAREKNGDWYVTHFYDLEDLDNA